MIGKNGLSTPMASGPIYDDGTYKYFGLAEVGTALNTASWQVSRMNIATKQVQWANNAEFTSVFTDVGTVAALGFA